MEDAIRGNSKQPDLKKTNSQFCKLWKCPGLKAAYSCSSCPVLADLKIMARAYNIIKIEDENSKAA